jgi:hypothetical protein
MGWVIESYCEVVSGTRVEVAEDEAIAMLHDPATRPDTTRLVAWLLGLEAGHGNPMPEPEMMGKTLNFKYRRDGAALVIFWVSSRRRRVDVLRFALPADGCPAEHDLLLAETRFQQWRG